LYLPEVWANDSQRRKKAGIPEEVQFQTKPAIALQQIQQAAEEGVCPAPVLADAAYGNDSKFREGIGELGLSYVVGVQSSMTVCKPGKGPLPKKQWKGRGRPSRLLQRDAKHTPQSVQQVALSLPVASWKTILWREGTSKQLRSRFAAVRVRPAHRDYWRAEPHLEEWLLIEWPKGEGQPTHYWLSNLPPETKLTALVGTAKHRWIVERDYLELKQELGLGHFEGRGWRGFHHHGLYASPRTVSLWQSGTVFPPPHASAMLDFPASPRSGKRSSLAARHVRAERHNPASITTLRIQIARYLISQLACCPFCAPLRL
jgi:SRSO17 transposase